ncbi:MAG: FtsX-like permease family protein [Rhodanobacter sp.]
MSIRHIVSSLRRNRLMPLLVILQVAIACAILCNAFFLLYQRLTPMLVPAGVAPGQVIEVDQITANGRFWSRGEIQSAALALQAIPGVLHATPAMGIPMSSSMRMTAMLENKDGVTVAVDGYLGEGLIDALGLDLVAGRDFLPGEYHDAGMGVDAGKQHGTQHPIIITQALADKLFPDGNALGKRLKDPGSTGGDERLVIGVVRHLMRYQLSDALDGKAEYSILVPGRIAGASILSFVVRTDADRRDQVLKAIPTVLKAQLGHDLMPGIDMTATTFESLRDDAFSSWRAAVWLLGTVCLVVVIVTAVGIMGLTGYWVQQRTRQVGIRRALGAGRGDILRYFQLENLLIVTVGVIVGMLFAYGINLYLMSYYELERLSWVYLPIGALVLWALGQLAVLGPALRAAAVPPVVATRSV